MNKEQRQSFYLNYYKILAEGEGGRCLSNQYIDCDFKLTFECYLGHVWEARPRKIYDGNWCPKCARMEARKYSVDDDFFSRDTEESFYIAGFWAADGWITRASGAYTVAICLAEKDLNHLINIKEKLKCEAPLLYRERDGYIAGSEKESHTKAYTLIFSSEKIFKDLARFGVVERKTYIYDMPKLITDSNLLNHFMRGYIDGDGCFCEVENKSHPEKGRVFFSMRGNYKFLQNFHDNLLSRSVVKQHKCRKPLTPKRGAKYPAFDTLRYGGNNVITSLHDFLYKDATIYLERKEEIAALSEKFLAVKRNPVGKISKDDLLEASKRLKTNIEIANNFNCTPANISWLTNHFGIREEISQNLSKNKPQTRWRMRKQLLLRNSENI